MVSDLAWGVDEPRKDQIVEHHRRAVGGRTKVAFNAISVANRGIKCRGRVFDDPACPIVQAAMGHRPKERGAIEHARVLTAKFDLASSRADLDDGLDLHCRI